MTPMSPEISEKLESLRVQFKEFRTDRKPFTPVPKEMLRGAIELIDQGVAIDQLAAACGVHRKQIYRWKKRHLNETLSKMKKAAVRHSPKARVLNLVSPDDSKKTPEVHLSFQSGKLSVSVSA